MHQMPVLLHPWLPRRYSSHLIALPISPPARHRNAKMVAGMEPNAENKLFVGGCPATSGEDELRALFEKHGQVEEVFVMRGGSRSGMACAFVRFASQPMAQAAIDAIHGRITLPDALEPLVVRWADAPGSRKRDGREGNRSKRGGSGGMGGGGGARDISSGMEGWPPHMMMPNHVYGGYPQMMMAQGHPHMMAQNPMMQQHAGVGNSLGGPQQFFHQGVGVGNFPKATRCCTRRVWVATRSRR